MKKQPQRENTDKEVMIKIIEDQPDDSSYDELFTELVFHRMILQGLKDVEEGRTISHEEMGRRIKSWQKKMRHDGKRRKRQWKRTAKKSIEKGRPTGP